MVCIKAVKRRPRLTIVQNSGQKLRKLIDSAHTRPKIGDAVDAA